MVTLRAAKTNHHTQRAAKAWRANTDATPKRITERGQRTSFSPNAQGAAKLCSLQSFSCIYNYNATITQRLSFPSYLDQPLGVLCLVRELLSQALRETLQLTRSHHRRLRLRTPLAQALLLNRGVRWGQEGVRKGSGGGGGIVLSASLPLLAQEDPPQNRQMLTCTRTHSLQ
eukprot:1073045-Prorocentrum_minimum.AAC.2